jgi:hypothetical protein
MLEKDITPEIIDNVSKWNWLVELSKANCPDKLMKTAIAVADHIHGRCEVGRCIKIPGDNCNDYGWAFPDQARDITAINGNNESSTSKKINELVEQGWLIKVVEKRYGAKVKNLFALSFGAVWKEPTKSVTDHLEGKGGKSKKDKLALAIVNPDKRGLSDSTSAGCQVRQSPVVNPDKVNINNKHELETLTENINTPAAPGHKVKIIDMNILDPKGKKRWGASRSATSHIPSTSLTSEYFFDGNVLKIVGEAISNTAVVKIDKREEDPKPKKVGVGVSSEDSGIKDEFVPFKEAMARREEILKTRPKMYQEPLSDDDAWTW